MEDRNTILILIAAGAILFFMTRKKPTSTVVQAPPPPNPYASQGGVGAGVPSPLGVSGGTSTAQDVLAYTQAGIGLVKEGASLYNMFGGGSGGGSGMPSGDTFGGSTYSDGGYTYSGGLGDTSGDYSDIGGSGDYGF